MTSNKRPDAADPAGLRSQFKSTRASLMRLVHAHIDLAKTELSDIMGVLKGIAAMAMVVLVLAFLLGNLLYVGGFLFVGEWIFGSIGWGLAHGSLLAIALIIAFGLGIIGSGIRSTVISLVLGILVTIAVAVLCGSNVAYDTANGVASSFSAPFGTPGVIALLGGVVLGAILFGLLLARIKGVEGLIIGLIIGGLLGALVGWLIAGAPWTWPPAVGLAITIGLASWPILNVIIAWPRINLEERFGQLYPRQSIAAAHETKAWLEEQWRTKRQKRDNG